MIERLFAPILKFFSSLGEQEKDDRLDALLRPYTGKKLWLAVAPDCKKIIFTALTLERLQDKADALGVQDFISCKAPKKIRGDLQ